MDEKKKKSIFVAKLDMSLADKLRDGVISQGFELSTPPYTVFAAKKKGVSCTLYKSGKLVVQGKAMGEFIEYYLEPEILGTFSYTYGALDVDTTARIGVDESGKGDFFGPLCVAAVYASDDAVKELYDLGVCDSKKLSDKRALSLSSKIKKLCQYHVLAIGPAKYNELYKSFGNLNTLLAWGHATTIEAVVKKTGCNNVIVDQFAAESVVHNALKRKGLGDIALTQRHRAEEDLVVAAASILARASYLEGLKKLGDKYGIELPKGASSLVISAGKRFVESHGKDLLSDVSKVHFRTYNDVMEYEL
ncbi:MAG: ribonuclease HIII [Waddliaceae bacterium]|jgi:ribonuclease HIII|nr:ribonuclease HIII [Waddliaceae bacterium]MBT3578984.1 ribonuclease HIII [Waddliaceae bacterium]MBT4444666.1 ribonuclease HIII [Waddliaceae bacterium]MBT6929181.1 ribonuclease HIII [Waddliaceae bacterium]MBT7265155.1 ribonuclease HIII [Waddliaceae bacterium]